MSVKVICCKAHCSAQLKRIRLLSELFDNKTPILVDEEPNKNIFLFNWIILDTTFKGINMIK